jgi:hypothetical protein
MDKRLFALDMGDTMITAWRTWRWRHLPSLLWGEANKRGVKIDWFCRLKGLLRDEIAVELLGGEKAIKSFVDAMNAAL